MSTDSTFDDLGFDKYIEESERDRNIRENTRLGYVEMGSGGNAVTPAEDPLVAFYEKQPPMSDAEQATFWKQQALARRVFNSTMAAERPTSVTPMDPPPIITVKHALDGLAEISKLPVFDTPHATLNKALGMGGFLGSQVYVATGGTGLGKTSFIGGIAQHTAQRRDVIWAFYEAFAAYPLVRIAAGLLNRTSNELIRDAEEHMEEMLQKLAPRIHLLDRPSLDMLTRTARYLADKSGEPPLMVIDYEQKLADQQQAAMKRPDARLAMSETSDGLLELANDTKASVLAVSSISRMNNRRANDVRKKSPYEYVDVAKESGAIEYDSAGLIMLSLSNETDGDERIGTMTIAKSRFGEGMHVDMRFDAKRGTWTDQGRVEADEGSGDGDAARQVVVAELEKRGPAKNPTELVKRCLGRDVARGALFAAIKEMTNETFEITRTDRGLELA